ncbi:predicted protein [Verticillium alfalfae VaMs.102]|uniref:Predicted protein n=1 Tax=Verticillium alfalfae (strain VaMs.102 / ATCC MYA-4576 / FGSC 10136) TaxID=526221 RepID=C9SE84_VERA1|nr:predicted protein [Verticillium alfalfae VaMs.102]EEY17308.1 predicted protein [Verticillium alfalfae VaMs.102]
MSRFYEQGAGEDFYRGRAPRRDFSPSPLPDDRPQYRNYAYNSGPTHEYLHVPPDNYGRPRSLPPQHGVIPRPPSHHDRSNAYRTRSPSRPNHHERHSHDRSPIDRACRAVDSTFTQTSSGLGVGLLGAVVGGLAAREASDAATRSRDKKDASVGSYKGRKSETDRSRVVSTVVGAIVGGLGANAIEKRFEHARERHRREQEAWERKWGSPGGRPRRDDSRGRVYGRDLGWSDGDDYGAPVHRMPRRLASHDEFRHRV